MRIKSLMTIVLVSVLSAVLAVTGYIILEDKPAALNNQQENGAPASLTHFFPTSNTAMAPPAVDFTVAAENSTAGVVHVTSTRKPSQTQFQRSPFEDLFGPYFQQPNRGPQKASGSGVIISPDGYIVTNNHVINEAEQIEIVLNDNQKYFAELIGKDPSTDLALLKIDATNDLQFIPFANSDSVKVGSWVLAVGNPFNLASTVTAGIVSAKGRNINILQDNAAVESFIQTDAAVNPGNSGGALVDLNGNLIGINTAIASPTGSYAGYSFAVPANLVQKVVRDLREYGIVQRGYLGVSIRNVDTDLASELELPDVAGVYINGVLEGSAADEAGLKQGDVIRKLDGEPVLNTPLLQENVARHRPGDQVTVEYVRNGKLKSTVVTLKNKNLGTELLDKESVQMTEVLGVALSDLSKDELKEMDIEGGVQVTQIGQGRVKRYTDMSEGFVITSIDREPVRNKEQFLQILAKKQGGVMVEGVYPGQPGTYYYAFGL